MSEIHVSPLYKDELQCIVKCYKIINLHIMYSTVHVWTVYNVQVYVLYVVLHVCNRPTSVPPKNGVHCQTQGWSQCELKLDEKEEFQMKRECPRHKTNSKRMTLAIIQKN